MCADGLVCDTEPRNTVMFVLPRMIIPASRSRCTMGELVEALAFKRAGEPAVVGMPRAEAVMKTSFKEWGEC